MNSASYDNYSLKNFNTYGIGGVAKKVVLPKTIDDFIKLLSDLESKQENYYILGNGSNVILPDANFDGTIVITKNINKYQIEDDTVILETGIMLPFINQELQKLGYSNFVWASGIPGTIGGSIKGNAGAYGHEMAECLISILVYNNGKVKEIPREDIEFTYRNSNIPGIILSAKYKLIKYTEQEIEEISNKTKNRFLTQPIGTKNAGSVFRNPSKELSAGKIIDDLGLKGHHVGDAMVSEKHANFIVNNGNATSDDIISLIKEIKQKVKDNYNIDLILEQKIVKWD